MWQRIQTLYLVIATALIASMFFVPKAIVPGADGTPVEVFRFTAYIPYLILLIVIVLLVTLALQVWLVVDYLATSDALVFRVAAIFPLVAVIFNVMAARRIWADQLLGESFSRLRSDKRRR